MKNTIQQESTSSAPERPRTLVSFMRAQVASLVSTAADFATTFLCKDIFGWWYVLATAIGALVGTIVNFMMGRNWVFVSKERAVWSQALRYGIISLGSLFLNTAGVWLWVESTSEAWVYPSKVVVGILVGFTWNFFMQKNFVYK